MATRQTLRRIRVELQNGRRVTIPAWVLDAGAPGPALLLTAAQHGNEVQGTEAIRRFVAHAGPRLRCGKVFAVPMANLPAIRDRRPHIRMRPEQPYSDARGHNMNRWWPGRPHGNDTARIPAAIYRAFGDEATHALDLHCWEKHGAPAVLIRDVPGIRELASRLGTRFVDVRPPGDHTLGGYFCATGRVGVTFEFSGQYVVDEQQVCAGLRVITNMARCIGLLPGRPAGVCAPVLFSDECATELVKAPGSGLFVGAGLQLGQPLAPGEVLGHVLSDRDLKRRQILAPAAGYLRAHGASRPDCDVAIWGHHPYVTRGERLARITVQKG